MIILDPKPLEEIIQMLEGLNKINIVGCGQCAKINLVGGEEQVQGMKGRLEEAGKEVIGSFVVEEGICHLPVSRERIGTIQGDSEAVLVLACGAAVQSIIDINPYLNPLPGLNSMALGNTVRIGEYHKKCSLCGECMLHLTAGICPIARCPKSMYQGPCGDSVDGKCGVMVKGGIAPEMTCVWADIYRRKGKISDNLTKTGPKDWSRSANADKKLTDEEIIGGREK